MLHVGQPAPQFKLRGYYDGDFADYSLDQFRGKWVVLFFYPLDFTFVCPTEVIGFRERLSDFQEAGAALLGVSVDSVHSHKAWVGSTLGGLNYPLLSDFQKEVTRSYDILKEDEGVAFRGTFIVDPEGVLRYAVVSDNNVGRSVDETLRVLQALQTGDLCPVGWRPGQKTLGHA